jgi:DNA-directed RNA polymerase subunit RPC12/RpoP
MSLGNMRSLGSRSLDVTCTACGHRIIFNVDDWPDEVLVPSFGPRMRCTKCGHRGASVRPDWTQLRAAPGKPR